MAQDIPLVNQPASPAEATLVQQQAPVLSYLPRQDPPPATSLTGHTVHGFFWTVANALGSKVVSLIQQIALAWILDKQDFGFIGLAYTVSTFASILQQGGVRDVLIQRGAEFDEHASPAFWLNFLLGLVGSIGMVAAAPLAAWFYGEPRVMGLIWVLAVQNFVASLTVLPEVRLTIDMRFRFLSILSFIGTVLTLVLTLLLAWRGFGAYSFVLPPLAAMVFRLVVLWQKTHIHPHATRNGWGIHEWKSLFGVSWMAIGATFFFTVVSQGDYVTLGHLRGKEIVGLYFWAFSLSIQTFQMVIVNAGTVLFPVFSRLTNDRPRQLAAFLKSARLIAMIAMPLTTLQFLLSDAGIRLVFAPRWFDAIPMAQILSLGLMMQVVGYPSLSLLKAQGRFAALLTLSFIMAISFLAMVIGAAEAFAGVQAAVAVSVAAGIFYLLSGPIIVYLAIRGIGGHWQHVWSILGQVTMLSILAAGLGLLADVALAHWTPAQRPFFALRVVVDTMVFVAAYVPLARILLPESFRELQSRLRLRKPAPAAAPLPA